MKIKIYNGGKLVREAEPDLMTVEVDGIELRLEEYDGQLFIRGEDMTDTVAIIPVDQDRFAVVRGPSIKTPEFGL